MVLILVFFTCFNRNGQSCTFVAKEFVLLLGADAAGCCAARRERGAGGDAPGLAGLIPLISTAGLLPLEKEKSTGSN